MSDDETRPIEPEGPPPSAQAGPGGTGALPDAPAPGVAGPSYAQQPYAQQSYAMPLPAGYPAYGSPQQRPRFSEQVIGMPAVIVVAVVCLLLGALSGAVLGRASDHADRFGGPDGGLFQRGGFPDGAPGQGFGPGR